MDRNKILRTAMERIEGGATGFTIDPNGVAYDPKCGGYAVGTQRFSCLTSAIESIQNHLYLGWWVSPEGETFIDLVEIFQGKATAFLAAYSRGELSIYDFLNDEEIDCRHFYSPVNQNLKEKEKDNEEVTSIEASSVTQAIPEGTQDVRGNA